MPTPFIVASRRVQALAFAKLMGWGSLECFLVIGQPTALAGVGAGAVIILLPNWRNLEGWDTIETMVAIAETRGAIVLHTAGWR